MDPQKKTLAILVGGGPAPGINGIIRSVTLEAINSGLKVLGIYDGFQHLMEGDISLVKELSIAEVSRIHFTGGSILRTSRANPTKKEEDLKKVVSCLDALHVEYLVTIGGDDTAFSAYKVGKLKSMGLQVAHVPKTIDNDLPLPGYRPTFGFHTARHYGTQIVQALMEDAKTTSRWFFVVSMGRKAGHLALGIAKAAGATLTIIGEEFKDDVIQFEKVCDILEGAMIKRLSMGRPHGVAIIAEGLLERMDQKELEKSGALEWDPHGNLRLDELDLGKILKTRVQERLKEHKIPLSITAKNIGYELRSIPPIPFDAEYTLDLGYAAVRFLLEGGTNAIVCLPRGGKVEALPFDQIINLKTGKISIRVVDLTSDSYQVALKYMIRLNENDFNDKATLKKLSATAHMTEEEFRKQFEYLVR